MLNQGSVVWTEPESGPTAESYLSAHFNITSYGIEVTSTDYLYITVSIEPCIKSTYSDDRLNASKQP